MSLNFSRPTLKPGIKSDFDEDDELLAAQEEYLRSNAGPSVRVQRVRRPQTESATNANNAQPSNMNQDAKDFESEFKKGVSFGQDVKNNEKPKKQSRFKQQRLKEQVEQDISDIKPDPMFENKI